jgi:sugar PTS system EIIA component
VTAALLVGAPVAGRVLALHEVPDPVFAQAMVGPGAAVDPLADGAAGPVADVVAPVAGTLVTVHPHAFVVRTDGGPAVLVHLGIDTVHLAGAPFGVLAREGDRVTAGDVVVRWDVAATAAAGRSAVVPVIVLEAPADGVVPASAGAGTMLAAGDPLLRVLHVAPSPGR